MMINTIIQQLKLDAAFCVEQLYGIEVKPDDLLINETKPEFEGDYSLVTFALSKLLKTKPDAIAQSIGEALLAKDASKYSSFAVIQGFLNVTIADTVFLEHLQQKINNTAPAFAASGKNIMVEFSSPNTNKPLHFGHLRNNFLGDSVSRILQAVGHHVIKSNLLNDRGIHICKSMYAWQHFGNGETPESSNKKGDHLVGHYYVLFENKMKEQAKELCAKLINQQFDDLSNEDATKTEALVNAYHAADGSEKQQDIHAKILDIAKANTPLMSGARELLVKWEQHDAETLALWNTMNSWVIAGFEATYARLGISFDQYYKESNTYLLGKEIVMQGLQKGVLFQKENNSIWVDLTADGLDEKLLLRGDGTSVYITQDIGTAQLKHAEFNLHQSIYVIADEQNYHMQVLKLVLQKLQEPCADGIHHLSYGLVELPSGRMKTREGTVVDADDTIDEMVAIAAKHTAELGKVDGFSESELQTLYTTIGQGALKFFLLRVDAKKKMIFNPEESIDFHGFTGPFVQYAHARTSAILRKAQATNNVLTNHSLLKAEKDTIKLCEQYQQTLSLAAQEFNPSILCGYIFSLAKQLNSFLAELKVLTAETEEKKQLRLQICTVVKNTIAHALGLLGMVAPEKM
jgi:arginyl-tRNA synthetase